MDYYIKKGRRYVKAAPPHEFGGFPCDGVWLVQTKPGCRSSDCILQIGDMPKLYPFASMMVHRDELATFLRKYRDEYIEKTASRDAKGGIIGWTEPSVSEQAAAIMEFLALQDTSMKNLEF